MLIISIHLILIFTQPFQKPLNRYLYIPFTSYHPIHAKRSFIEAELIRYVRLSSKLSDFLDISKKFFIRLQNRGYPKQFILDIFSKVHYGSRWKYLAKMSVESKDKSHMRFFKMFRNPLFNNVHLKNLFTFQLGGDFDTTSVIRPLLTLLFVKKSLGLPSQH